MSIPRDQGLVAVAKVLQVNADQLCQMGAEAAQFGGLTVLMSQMPGCIVTVVAGPLASDLREHHLNHLRALAQDIKTSAGTKHVIHESDEIGKPKRRRKK